MNEAEIMDRLTKVCLCKAIPRIKIKNAIRQGALTVKEVNKKVGSGSGNCHGTRCGPKINSIIEDYKNGVWK